MLGPILFNIFISDLDEKIKSTISKFLDGTKLGGVDDTPDGCATIQHNVDRTGVLCRWESEEVQEEQVNGPALGGK